jgi:hypothetical protein
MATHLDMASGLRMSGVIPSLPPCTCMAGTTTKLRLPLLNFLCEGPFLRIFSRLYLRCIQIWDYIAPIEDTERDTVHCTSFVANYQCQI